MFDHVPDLPRVAAPDLDGLAPSRPAPTGPRARRLPRRGARRRLKRYGARLSRALSGFAAGDLPADLCCQAPGVGLLFRASRVLNAATGGDPEMTFSARCHAGRAGPRPLRLVWATLGGGIDLACAMLRGECEHCATAWANHLARPKRRRR